MNDRSNRSSPRVPGVRAFTVILLALFFVTAAVFMLFPDKGMFSTRKKTSAPPPPEAGTEKLIFTLNQEALESKIPEIPDAAKTGPQKLGYNFGVEDATGRGDVRVSNAKIGVDYKVSENSTVGVEASQGIHDSQDAAAWGRSVEDETSAQAKYKLSF
jgi:hypothetical protein